MLTKLEVVEGTRVIFDPEQYPFAGAHPEPGTIVRVTENEVCVVFDVEARLNVKRRWFLSTTPLKDIPLIAIDTPCL